MEQVVLNSFKAMKENDFSKQVLVPLMYKLGWEKVVFHGGPYEGGKDIICWKKDEIDESILGVVQVKKIKISAKASSKNSLMEVVNQIQQAMETYVPNEDGKKYKPSIVYFFTPYEVDARTLEARFEKYKELRSTHLKFIDGSKLIYLLKKHLPEILQDHAGSSYVLTEVSKNCLNNKVLLSALKYRKDVNISGFYCDLDFTIGNITTKLFFEIPLLSSRIEVDLNQSEWEQLLGLEKECNRVEISIFSCSVDEIINEFTNKNEKYEKRTAQMCSIIDILDDFEFYLHAEHETLLENQFSDEAKGKFISKIESLCGEIFFIFENDGGQERIKKSFEIFTDHVQGLKKVLNESKNGEKVKSISIDFEAKMRGLLENTEDQRDDLVYNINKIISKNNKPKYVAKISSEQIVDFLNNKKQWLYSKLVEINNKLPSRVKLREFLSDCERLFKFTNSLLSNYTICELINVRSGQSFTSLPDKLRLSVGIDKLIDSGYDFLLFGEAGAGKTTSLQMYAHDSYVIGDKDRLVLFFPLAAVLSDFKVKKINGKIDALDNLLSAIKEFLKNEGINIDESDIYQSISAANSSTLLLDGVDEAIKNAPWIIQGINEIKNKIPKCQIVVSARSGGEYLEKLSFLGVSLLPFSDTQKTRFINKWFECKDNIELADKVICHLGIHKELSAIIKNPLLATILCILAENGIPLPDTEITLYEERIRLLLGDYDIAKKSYRIDSSRTLLETIARKIAFKLHFYHKRHAPFKDLKNYAISYQVGKYSEDQIEIALNELIYPCNILMPMTPEGNLGFGHLRYQEYLSASEIIHNRGVKVESFLHDIWWKGALIIYSQMADDIENLIEWIALNDDFQQCEGNMMAMINVRSEKESSYLSDLYQKQLSVFDPI